MSASAITERKEIIKKIKTLIEKGVHSVEVQELAEHVYLGGERIVEQPVAVQVEGKNKSIVFFEHYRVERDENEAVKLSIKYGRADCAESEFIPYSYNLNDWLDKENIVEIRTRWGSFKWVLDIPLDNSSGLYNSFVEKGNTYGAKLEYIELAYIIKMAEYLNMMHYIDHDFLIFMSKYKLQLQEKSTLKFLELKQVFLELFEVVYAYLDKKYEVNVCKSYWNSQVGIELKKNLKSMCSTRIKFLFDSLTQKVDIRRNGNFKRTLRIGELASFSEWFSPYMQRVKQLEKYSKAQLYYLLVFQGDIDQINNLDFFSHENMILKNDENLSFKFPNKRAMKKFNQMNVEILDKFFCSYEKSEFLKDWWVFKIVEPKQESNFYINKHIEDFKRFNLISWQFLMAWLTHGECHVQLRSQKYDKDKIKTIYDIIRCIDFTKPSLKDGFLIHEGESGFSQSINLEKVVLAFDFSCKYLDHISEDLRKDEEKLERAVKIAKEKFKNDFSQRELNRLLRKEMEKELEAKVRIYDQKKHIFYDYITYQDDNWEAYINVESISRTTTFKSIERKIERWHDELNTYTLEELEEAKNKKYDHLKSQIIEYKEGVFEPITNKYDLMIEGAEMRHCVEAFDNMVSMKQYVVFTVQHNEERATLGVYIDDSSNNLFEFAQCYKKYNHLVSSEMNTLVKGFVEHINKHPKLILEFSELS